MLDSIGAGTTDPHVLAELAQGKLRAKLRALGACDRASGLAGARRADANPGGPARSAPFPPG